MKRIIPFISCLITFAHAQVERFDMTYTLQVQQATNPSGEKLPVTARGLNHAVLTLDKRLRALTAKKAKVTAKGTDRILVIIPQLSKSDINSVRAALVTPAHLELTLVHPETRSLANKVAEDPQTEIVPGYELKVIRDTDADGNETSENILIKSRAALDETYIVQAKELQAPYEGPIDITLNDEGAQKMLDLTKKMQHGRDRLAIVLDGKVLSAPVVQSSLSKKFQISGMGTAENSRSLAAALLNPLKNPIILEDESRTPSHLLTDPSKKAAP